MSVPAGQPAKASINELHEIVAARLAAEGQRYTGGRRRLVEVLERADGPMAMPAILNEIDGIPQSSAYRHLTVLAACGVVHRVAGNDELGLFELTEELSGAHHHHVVCGNCGVVVDVSSSSDLERALAKAAAIAADETGYEIDAHRIDLVGTCPSCLQA